MRRRFPPGCCSLRPGALPWGTGRSRHASGARVAVGGGGGVIVGGGGGVAVGAGAFVAVAGGCVAGGGGGGAGRWAQAVITQNTTTRSMRRDVDS